MKKASLKHRLHEIIYEADTPAGKVFDIGLLVLIVFSVILVILESVSSIRLAYATLLNQLEWLITVVFSLEYIARILVVKKPWKYITSFFGLIDLLSLLPKYISFFLYGFWLIGRPTGVATVTRFPHLKTLALYWRIELFNDRPLGQSGKDWRIRIHCHHLVYHFWYGDVFGGRRSQRIY